MDTATKTAPGVRGRIQKALRANGAMTRRQLSEALRNIRSDALELYCQVLVEDGLVRFLPDDGTNPSRFEAVA